MTDPEVLFSRVAALMADHQRQLGERGVAPSEAALTALDDLEVELSETGCEPEQVVDRLASIVGPATVASSGPRYFGFVTGGSLPVAIAADWMVSGWDQNAALSLMSPPAARCELVALGWVKELLGLPDAAEGSFVTGATMANAAALAAARDWSLDRLGWDPDAGLVGAPPLEVVVGAEAHSTVHKALGLVGLGRERVRRLPVDSQGAIDASSLPPLSSNAIVCLQAGNVNSGASDPFDPLIDWAHRHGSWVHVDGAFGLWAAASPAHREQVAGVERADSWATDAHKWLNVPYDSGIVLVRDGGALRTAMGSAAAYLPGAGRETMHLTPSSSQRARGIVVWAALSALGRRGVADLVSRCCELATLFATRLSAMGHEILNDVVLNQVVVTFGSDETTEQVIAAVQRDGTCWAGPTIWRGRRAMRISVSNWSTTSADVELSAEAIDRCARGVKALSR